MISQKILQKLAQKISNFQSANDCEQSQINLKPTSQNQFSGISNSFQKHELQDQKNSQKFNESQQSDKLKIVVLTEEAQIANNFPSTLASKRQQEETSKNLNKNNDKNKYEKQLEGLSAINKQQEVHNSQKTRIQVEGFKIIFQLQNLFEQQQKQTKADMQEQILIKIRSFIKRNKNQSKQSIIEIMKTIFQSFKIQDINYDQIYSDQLQMLSEQKDEKQQPGSNNIIFHKFDSNPKQKNENIKFSTQEHKDSFSNNITKDFQKNSIKELLKSSRLLKKIKNRQLQKKMAKSNILASYPEQFKKKVAAKLDHSFQKLFHEFIGKNSQELCLEQGIIKAIFHKYSSYSFQPKEEKIKVKSKEQQRDAIEKRKQQAKDSLPCNKKTGLYSQRSHKQKVDKQKSEQDQLIDDKRSLSLKSQNGEKSDITQKSQIKPPTYLNPFEQLQKRMLVHIQWNRNLKRVQFDQILIKQLRFIRFHSNIKGHILANWVDHFLKKYAPHISGNQIAQKRFFYPKKDQIKNNHNKLINQKLPFSLNNERNLQKANNQYYEQVNQCQPSNAKFLALKMRRVSRAEFNGNI